MQFKDYTLLAFLEGTEAHLAENHPCLLSYGHLDNLVGSLGVPYKLSQKGVRLYGTELSFRSELCSATFPVFFWYPVFYSLLTWWHECAFLEGTQIWSGLCSGLTWSLLWESWAAFSCLILWQLLSIGNGAAWSFEQSCDCYGVSWKSY